MDQFLAALGDEIADPEEEAFLVFSQAIPSSNLGFVDARARVLEISVGGRDLTVHQSPTVLSSNRKEGTTGAVVWKVTPLFAEWIASEKSILFQTGALGPASTVLELGCGVSGIVGLALAPRVGRYIATDQDYVLKLLKQNIAENAVSVASSTKASNKRSRGKSQPANSSGTVTAGNIDTLALDWEKDSVSSLPDVDVVIACDCTYNDALIEPFVTTCAEICRLKSGRSDKEDDGEARQTICIVAQQLRSSDVFEAWLKAFHRLFRVWRVPDEFLTEGLREGKGFVVHVGVLR